MYINGNIVQSVIIIEGFLGTKTKDMVPTLPGQIVYVFPQMFNVFLNQKIPEK